MRCLVTGGTGFLGRHLVEQLLGAGHEVRALVRRDAAALERAGAILVPGDVLRAETIRPAAEGVEVVFHLAGAVSHGGTASETFRLNVEGTRNTLAAAREAGVARFVHMSSSGTCAVSRHPEMIATEGSPWATEVVRRWPYYLSKIYAEKLALEAHERGELPVVVVNPSLLLGPQDESLGASQVILRFLRREIPAIPPGGLNFVDVRDAAAATVAAATQGRLGERYLLGGPNMTLEAFFVLLERVSGIPAPPFRAPARLNEVTAELLETLEGLGESGSDDGVTYAMAGLYWYLDASKAKRELGFRTRSPEATLRDAVAWIRQRGPLPRPTGWFGSAVRTVRKVLDPR